MTEQDIQNYYKKITEECDVKIGDIFYHADNPTEEWEVIRSEILGSSLYFWIVSFNSREIRLCKSVELYKDSKYFTYFRTIEEAKWQQHSNMERELQILTDNLHITKDNE